MNNQKVLDISWGTIFKLFIAIVCFYILFLIKDIIVWFLFALIISILFNPAIDFLQRRRIPRVVSVVFIYLCIFGILSYLIFSFLPLFISEIENFSKLLPQYFEKAFPFFQGLGIQAFQDTESFVGILGDDLQGVAANMFSAFFAIFGGIFSTMFVITMAIFLSLEEKVVEKTLILFFPKEYEEYALNLWPRCQKKVGGWFLTRVIACLFVGAFSYLAFALLNTEYPFSLGLLAGVLNFIPIVGPIITSLLIFFIVALDSFTKAIFALVAFTLIQQIENNILTPILSQRFVGLSPVLTLVALAVGGTLWGILGAILVIPLVGILFEFTKDFLQKRKKEFEEEKAPIL
ncbi:AI-2E family transporter [Candidatus Parcubacteria bacterium]|nr:AI-2E family transporter [Candidatus Parcubacteria bacterium]